MATVAQLVKITFPGKDAVGIMYPDGDVLFIRGKQKAQLITRLELQSLADGSAKKAKNKSLMSKLGTLGAVGVGALGPVGLASLGGVALFDVVKKKKKHVHGHMTITVISEREEQQLGGDLKGLAGVSLKNSQEGIVIPAVAARGDIYFRKGNDVIRLDDFMNVIRQGYIMASRLEPGFDWDGVDEGGVARSVGSDAERLVNNARIKAEASGRSTLTPAQFATNAHMKVRGKELSSVRRNLDAFRDLYDAYKAGKISTSTYAQKYESLFPNTPPGILTRVRAGLHPDAELGKRLQAQADTKLRREAFAAVYAAFKDGKIDKGTYFDKFKSLHPNADQLALARVADGLYPIDLDAPGYGQKG
jgi:hypothetical protein